MQKVFVCMRKQKIRRRKKAFSQRFENVIERQKEKGLLQYLCCAHVSHGLGDLRAYFVTVMSHIVARCRRPVVTDDRVVGNRAVDTVDRMIDFLRSSRFEKRVCVFNGYRRQAQTTRRKRHRSLQRKRSDANRRWRSLPPVVRSSAAPRRF